MSGRTGIYAHGTPDWPWSGQLPQNPVLGDVFYMDDYGSGIWGTWNVVNGTATFGGTGAGWIWAGGSNSVVGVGGRKGPFLLTHTFNYGSTVNVTFSFTCDNFSSVWLNGVKVGDSDNHSVIVVNNSVGVRNGSNTITAVVRNLEDPGAAGFIAVVKRSDNGSVVTKTDRGWKYLIY